LNKFVKLNAYFYTTDLIIAEIRNSKQKSKIEKLINQGILKIIFLKYEELSKIYTLRQENNALAVEDCSVWYIAQKYNGILLTGDKKLRKQAYRNGINVRGILYIFDELVQNEIIEKQTAREKLLQLNAMNPRLPEEEINHRLKKWKK